MIDEIKTDHCNRQLITMFMTWREYSPGVRYLNLSVITIDVAIIIIIICVVASESSPYGHDAALITYEQKRNRRGNYLFVCSYGLGQIQGPHYFNRRCVYRSTVKK